MRGYPDIRNLVAAFLAVDRVCAWCDRRPGSSRPRICGSIRRSALPRRLARDDDRTLHVCGALIDNAKTEKADRIKALIARAAVYERKDMTDRAIADYDSVLRLDPALADIHNARGELWRKKGDLPKAVADFAAAIKLNPEHIAARANHRSLALELERLGALKAVAGKPSFNCATARRKVEKAICANPELADLDREVHGSYVRAARESMTPQPGAHPAARAGGISSPAATPHSAGRTTTCKRRCASGCNRSTGSMDTSGAAGFPVFRRIGVRRPRGLRTSARSAATK